MRLATEARKYFGFSWRDKAGVDRYYVFTVMVYGFAAAAAVVTRLIKPILGFVHQIGVRASIYMDDGNVVGSTQEEAEEATQLVLDCMQLAGWNIQWAKTTSRAVTTCKYLGFVINLEDFTYQASDGKVRKAEIMLTDLAQAAEQGEPVDAKHLAAVLSNVIALRTSHGSVVQHMTKELQHELGAMVHQFGWDCQLMIGREAQAELTWLQSNLAHFNGKGIRNERGQEAVHRAKEAVSRESMETAEEQEQLAAERLRSVSYTLKLNQEIELTEELPDDTTDGWQQAIHELDTIAGLMQLQDKAAEHAHWERWFWCTGSRNCHVWLKKGSRNVQVKERLLRLQWVGQSRKIDVTPVWQPADENIIQEADRRSKLTTSTDEWGVDRACLHKIFRDFECQPTIDAFASSENSVCGKFFSKWPQSGATGVNFFAQELDKEEIYFCCPPVKDIGHTIRRLQRHERVTAVLVLPAWPGHMYWGMLRTGTGFVSEVKRYQELEPDFQDTGRGRSIFVKKAGMKIWAALWHSGSLVFKITRRHIHTVERDDIMNNWRCVGVYMILHIAGNN